MPKHFSPTTSTTERNRFSVNALANQSKSALAILILIVVSLFAAVFMLYVANDVVSSSAAFTLAYEHPAAMIGLPLCAIASLSLVLLLRTTSGPIEFEAIGFKFKGAAGPIIMWAITYIVMALSVKLLW